MCVLLFLLTFIRVLLFFYFFFFNDTATTEIYTLSLHDALPISLADRLHLQSIKQVHAAYRDDDCQDRKSTRLNSSHLVISYAVFCLKKKTIKACGDH